MFAQPGGDGGDWVFIVAFCLWPFHIGRASGIMSAELVGYGASAIFAQSFLLLTLLVIAPFVFRSTRVPAFLKTLYLPVGYPLVMLGTNLIPAFLYDLFR